MIKNNDNTTTLVKYLKTHYADETRPLTKQEERDMIQKYKNDRSVLNHKLFMHNIKLVLQQAKRFVAKTDDFDNIVQEGMRGLAEACTRFDVNKDIKFITYGQFWIRKYMLATFYGKSVDIARRSISLDAPISVDVSRSDQKNSSEVSNFIANEIDPTYIQQKPAVDTAEKRNICKHLFARLQQTNTLSAIEKNIANDLFIDELKVKDVSNKHNISQSEVSKVKCKVLSFFKGICKNELGIHSSNDITVDI